MRYADFYRESDHPRRAVEMRGFGPEGLHLTRIRQGAHGLDDPPTDELVVGVVLGGVTRCRWTWGDGWNETARRTRGDIGLTPPRAGGTFEVDGDHEILVVGIPLPVLTALGGDAAARSFGRLHDAYHRDPEAFGLCGLLWNLAARRDPAAAMAADSVATALIARWRALAERAPPAPRTARPLSDRAFAAVLERVEAAPADRHPLSAWAGAAGMTVPAFIRAFRSRTGLPPHRWLIERRIALAEEMLARPGSDIEAIADATGFDSRSHFTRTFTRLRGRSPRAPRG